MSDFESVRKRLEEAPPWHAEDVRFLLAEVERLRAAIHGRTLIPELVEKDRENLRLRAEVERLRGLVEQAEADIKAMGFEAHPAVLMRMDRLVRALRGEREK